MKAVQIKVVECLLDEETRWWAKLKLRLLLIWLCLRRRNAESRKAVSDRLGSGFSNIQWIFFTERGVGPACLLLMAACCGTVGEGVVPFLVSALFKTLLLVSVFGCVSMSRIKNAIWGRKGRYVKTMWLALFAWAMVNLLFTVVEIPIRCGEEVSVVLYIILMYGPVAIIAFILAAGGIVNICRRRGTDPEELKILEDAMHFLICPVKAVWKLAQKKGKIRTMFILAACICGTVDVRLYVPFQFNKALFWVTTSTKAFMFVLFLGLALKLAKRRHIVPVNLENNENVIGGVNWCYEVLETVALVNLLTAFPVQNAVGFLVICVAVNLLINLGCAVYDAWAPADVNEGVC